MTTPPTEEDSVSPSPLRRRVGWALLHAWLVFHVFSIAVGPSSVPKSSELQRASWQVVGPYLETISLNHGWHYFAPDPGASTLLEYEGVTANGTRVAGRLPDKATQPRLLYHRDFMMTEALAGTATSDPDLRDAYLQGLANGIGQRTGATEVTLRRVVHSLPTMKAVRGGFPLDDPAQYHVDPLGEFRCER